MPAVNISSSLRSAHAAQTRQRILIAATPEFERQGFAGTRIDAIAAAAEVAVPTVYKVFANKAKILIGAVNLAMAGDQDAPIDQQAWFTEQLNEPDPVHQLQLIARNARRMYERAAQLLNVLRAAAPLDREVEAAWHDIASQRVERSRRTARNLGVKVAARRRLARKDTAITLLVLTEPELYTTFIARNRSASQYEHWLADILCRSLLD